MFFLFDKVQYIGVMNAYRHAHISGVLLSLNDNGGDYYLAGRAVRNVVEYVARQTSLPNNILLPCHLPLPIPAFDSSHPLQLNPETGKYYQPSENNIRFNVKKRYLSQRSVDARSKVTSIVQFSPALEEDPEYGTVVNTYKVDAVGMPFITLSDGAAAISAGLGAAFPSCDFMHIECWSHLHPLSIKNQFINSNTLSFSIPDSAFENVIDLQQKKNLKSRLKRKVIDFIVHNLNLCRETISSALADIMMENLVVMIRDGSGSRGTGIALEELSLKVKNKYGRVTENGSFGLWRKSDICDMSFDHFDIDDGKMIQSNPRISNFVSGIPTSQSSIEAVNHRTKVELERRPLETCRLMEFFTGFISDIVKKDYGEYGFSYAAVPYGTGTGSNRATSSSHNKALADGMLFLGRGRGVEMIYDQRSYYHKDVSHFDVLVQLLI